MEFKIVPIIRPGSRDYVNKRASWRLVTFNEAKSCFQKILEDWEPLLIAEQKVRLKNGYLTPTAVEANYVPGIAFELVTPATDAASSCSVGQALVEEVGWRIAMAYACEHDDWWEVEEIVKCAGGGILAALLPHEYQGTVLHVCALFESTETLGRLLKMEGVQPHLYDCYGESPLHSAAFRGSVGAARLILATPESKEMLNLGNCYGNTPLIHSVRYSQPELCKLLLDTGEIRRDVGNNNGETALHIAVKNEAINMVDIILSHPHSTNSALLVRMRNLEGQTPLHLATSTGQLKICSRLLECDASCMMITDNGQQSPLHLANGNHNVLELFLACCNYETCLKLCADYADLINHKLKFGLTALHIAATLSNAESAEVLIKKGAFMDLRNDDGDTALHTAVRGGHLEVFQFLLQLEEHQCNFSNHHLSHQQWLSMQNSVTGDTALHIAVRNSRNSNTMALDLIKKRVFVDVSNGIGETPLHIAAREGDFVVLQALLNQGMCATSPGTDWSAWVSMCDSEGETALHEAVREGREDVVDKLLEQPNATQLLKIRDIDNRTALHWALRLSDPVSMLKRLLNVITDQKTKPFLMWNLRPTLTDNHPAIEKKLMEEGLLERHELSSDRQSEIKALLETATEFEDLEMATELISKGADITTLQNPSARTWLSDNLCGKPSDRPAPQDSLGRKPLVDGIAALLLSPFTGTPITIGVFGEWGMGKSSVMLQVEEALLEMAANEIVKVLPPHFKSLRLEVAKALQLNVKDISDDQPIRYRSDHHQLFKDLASTHRSTLVSKSAIVQSLKEAPDTGRIPAVLTSHYIAWRYQDKIEALKEALNTGQIPAVLTVRYNAWRYQDKIEASAGLAIEVSQAIEMSMLPSQWLRMCWKYSWECQSREIFVQLVLPFFVAALAVLLVVILWNVVPIKTVYKAISLPASFLGVVLLLFHTGMGILPPITQKILSYVQTPDHRPTLGYQHRVIRDIQFLKEQLCAPPNRWWRFLGFFSHWFTPKLSYYMQGTGVKKQAPPKDNLRIVVFIDDLDRCQQHIILEVLSTINLILAACEINVVLGIDKAMVQRALIQAFLNESITNADSASVLADKYLRKIIQLPIQLPDLSRRDLMTFLEGQIGCRFTQSINAVPSSFHDSGNHSLESNFSMLTAISNCSPSGAVNDQLETSEVEENSGIPALDKPPITTSTSMEGISTSSFRLILANYSRSEAQMLQRLCGRAQGDRKLPREWKRFLNYHRLTSNILLQDSRMKSHNLKGWRRKLILWIFICWNWTEEMNTIIKAWHGLILNRQLEQGRGAHEPRDRRNPDNHEEITRVEDLIIRHVVAKQESLEEEHEFIEDFLFLGDVIGMHLEKLEAISQAELPGKRNWEELRKLLQEEGDLRIDFIGAFQQFRFNCELDHLEISQIWMKKKRKKTIK